MLIIDVVIIPFGALEKAEPISHKTCSHRAGVGEQQTQKQDVIVIRTINHMLNVDNKRVIKLITPFSALNMVVGSNLL